MCAAIPFRPILIAGVLLVCVAQLASIQPATAQDPMPSPDPAFPAYAVPSTTEFPPENAPLFVQQSPRNCFRCPWDWQLLPDGLIYHSYLGGVKEPRFGSNIFHEKDDGWLWDVALGGRVGIVRFGDHDTVRPQGWQLDMEGAAFPRLDLANARELVSVDFRFGVPITYGWGPFQTKFGYYHLSSHIGDEFLELNPGYTRLNYVRDAIVLGQSYYVNDDIRLYGEVAWSFFTAGGAEPWELQFGVDYSPLRSRGIWGTPFAAANAHLREENDFGGNLSLQAGWQWRGIESGRLWRMGLQYFNGKSNQAQFYNHSEEQIGFGMWFDY